MKCKYCNEEIKQDNEGEDYYSVISRFFTCTDNPNQCRNHEPAEPEAQGKNNEGVNRTNQAASPVTEGSQQMETVAENEQRSMRETKLVADNGPRVDTRRVPLSSMASPYLCGECGEMPAPCHHFSRLGAATQATEARPEIHTVGFKPLMGEAAAQKVEQPAVDPQKLGHILDRGVCRFCQGSDIPNEAWMRGVCPKRPEAESTHPELCLAVMSGHQALPGDKNGNTLIRCQLLKGHEKDGSRCSNSTRPEMPPKVQCGNCNTNIYLVAFNKELGGIVLKCAGCLEQKLVEVGAASVQQEPLNCHRCFEVSNQVLEHVNVLENANDSEEYYSAAFELRKILPSLDQFVKLEIEDALKAAAPRTQGRELTCSEAMKHFEGCDKCSESYLEEGASREARTQPAPRTPACPECGHGVTLDYDDINGFNVQCGEHGEHYWDALCFQELDKFFTALPEATKEEK